jgi:hypothetical protein
MLLWLPLLMLINKLLLLPRWLNNSSRKRVHLPQTLEQALFKVVLHNHRLFIMILLYINNQCSPHNKAELRL